MNKPINLKTAMAKLEALDVWLNRNHPDETAVASTAFNESAKPLQMAISVVEGRACVRTIRAIDVCRALRDIERKLALPKVALEGVEVDVDLNAQTFPRAYKWQPDSTQFKAIYRNRHWSVTEIGRERCRGHKEAIHIKMPPETLTALARRYESMSMFELDRYEH